MFPIPHSRYRRASVMAVAIVVSIVLAVPASASAPMSAIMRLEPVLDLVVLDAAAVNLDDVHLVFPQDPSVTNFDDTWGHGRSGGRRHVGSDLMAPKMSPVYAVADGIVSIMKRGGSAGWWIGIEHARGLESWYMHLNNDTPGTDNGRAEASEIFAPGLELGAFVTAGQLIGYVGDSGNAEGSGSHTHFELHVNGSPIDPYPLLVAAHERALQIRLLEARAEVADLAD